MGKHMLSSQTMACCFGSYLDGVCELCVCASKDWTQERQKATQQRDDEGHHTSVNP